MYATEANLVARFGQEIEELKLMHAVLQLQFKIPIQDATEKLTAISVVVMLYRCQMCQVI